MTWRVSKSSKWKEGSPIQTPAQLNPNSSRPRDRSLNIEALFRCMDCSPCLPISISFPPAERLNLIQTHWCVDNEGVTRSWERPSNSPHRGSGFFGWSLNEYPCSVMHALMWACDSFYPNPRAGVGAACIIQLQWRMWLQTWHTQKWSCALETLASGLAEPERRCIYHNMTADGNINVKFKLKACMEYYGSPQFIILFQQNEE